jgi:hypothetical protein
MDLLNDFIKQNFSGKSICELAQIEQKLQDTKELLKWIDKCSVLEGKLLQKDKENALLKEALMVACEEAEYYISAERTFSYPCEAFGFTNKQYDCDNDCGVCLREYFMKRAQDNIDMEENNKEVKNDI